MNRILVYHPTRAAEYGQLLAPLLAEAELLVAATVEEAAAAIVQADVAFVWRLPIGVFARAERLRWVQAMGAGVEDLIGAPLRDGCRLTRVEGLFGGYMSEFAFAHMLAHTQQMRRLYANQAESRWEPFQIGLLAGKRLGVAGAGSIGGAIAHLGKAFGMEVWALTRQQRALAGVDRCFTAGEIDQFLGGVDYLVSSLPLTPETTGLIDPRLMKTGSLLVNVGRGATVNEGALLSAAQAGKVQAVLDVFTVEPLPAEHPFWQTPGITVTPHIAGPSVPADVAQFFAANLRRFEAGEPLVGLVDRERGY